HVGGQFNLGILYYHGRGVPRDYKQALYWFRKAAEQGHADAQFNLGILYYHGRGVPRDYKQALYWSRKAAEQGHADAQFDLGLMYSKGIGAPQDYKQAAHWWRKAAEQGDAQAQANLAVLCALGRGVFKDLVQAHVWASLAAAGSSGEDAQRINRFRDKIAAKMTPAQIAEAQRLARVYSVPGRAGAPANQAAIKGHQGKAPPKRFRNSVGMEFVLIPAGSFMMGSPADEQERNKNNEGPRHRVEITRPFYLQTTEVTRGQWRAVMGNNPSHFKQCGDDCPVDNVSWEDIQEFVRRLNQREGKEVYRLPTEAEWEYACRAGTTTPFYFGETISPDQANYNGRHGYGAGRKGVFRNRPVPVKSFPSNAWGLYDMHGNVWELVSDWKDDDYYSSSPVRDPRGPSSGSVRVIRGGAWDNFPENLRSARRLWHNPKNRYDRVGFRVARVITP
ncbi:MAG: hypothetical protein C4525_09730, partial [Desulfarculus sp.]